MTFGEKKQTKTTMHWAPIPISEFTLLPQPPNGCVTDRDIFRLLSRAPRRGFWLSAIAFIILLAIGECFYLCGEKIVGGLIFAFGLLPGTGHILIRHKINLALWACREPAAVFWAEPKKWKTGSTYMLRLHTPAPIILEAVLTHEELQTVLHWFHRRHPEGLIGEFWPGDSDGRLTGKDPWSNKQQEPPNQAMQADGAAAPRPDR